MYANPQKTFQEMKTDIILCGVGGQGILSIATVIGEAATAAGLQLKQAEVKFTREMISKKKKRK